MLGLVVHPNEKNINHSYREGQPNQVKYMLVMDGVGRLKESYNGGICLSNLQ